MNNLLKRTKKDSHQRKEQIHLEGQSLNFLCQRYFQKKRCVTKKTFRGPWPINCQKQFTNLVYGEYVAQTFNFSSLSKIKLPFQKAIFTRHIARIVEKTNELYVFPTLAECYFAITSFHL